MVFRRRCDLTIAQRPPGRLLLSLLLAAGLASAQDYVIQRSSVNNGGSPCQSTSFRMNGSAGQAVQGTGTASGYLGYWGFWFRLGPGLPQDVGATVLVAPVGVLDTSTAVIPSARVKNFGEGGSTFLTIFRIDKEGQVVYADTQMVSLVAGAERTLTFDLWLKPHAVAIYTATCSTALGGDVAPENNAVAASFRVTAGVLELGWVRKYDMPSGTKNKRVKDGGCLAFADTALVYALKGNGTYEFYRYNTRTNAWATRESVPAIGSSGKKKGVKKGAALTAVGTAVFAAKGNGTSEFWCYRSDSTGYPWQQMADIPLGSKAPKEGTGAAVVTLGDTTYIYFLKGSATQEFYRYNTAANSWERKADAPLGASGKVYKNGSALASDGEGTVFALKGSYNEFFIYRCDSDVWTSRTSLPLMGSSLKKKKVKDGAGLAWLGGTVYALKGGNTNEFWQYAADSDRWTQLADMPVGIGKRVKGGGALAAASGLNALYALRGNNTLEMYRYGLPAFAGPQASSFRPQAMAQAQAPSASSTLRIAPNPFSATAVISYSLPRGGNVSLRLYDVSGKLVTALGDGYREAGASSFRLQASGLSAGVYVLRLETEHSTATAKLIMQ